MVKKKKITLEELNEKIDVIIENVSVQFWVSVILYILMMLVVVWVMIR